MAQVSAALGSPLRIAQDPAPAILGKLTIREREVLDLILAGQSNRQIAQRLFLSPETVKTHVRHILAKTGATRKVQLRTMLQTQGRA
ncbi:MAG: helix-turn-helix transcriptional regulator [Anaerolineales bacterium]|jgi:DNA-binding CsgD family transcriptional regulator